MGMSTYVQGYRPPDAKWQKMKAVFDACIEAKLEPPDEVQKFFGWERPDPSGVEVEIPHTEYSDRDTLREGIEIDVSQIPKGVTKIRFVNSY
jgi:hypothetical protein